MTWATKLNKGPPSSLHDMGDKTQQVSSLGQVQILPSLTEWIAFLGVILYYFFHFIVKCVCLYYIVTFFYKNITFSLYLNSWYLLWL